MSKSKQTAVEKTELFANIRLVLTEARSKLQQTVNHVMVHAYWQVGRLIVEHEQQGETKAQYGKETLNKLAEQLTREFGKGFDSSNLRRMRQFYLIFPNCGTVSHKLSWSHYRYLIQIENAETRKWYMEECLAQNWSVRALDRQISKLYYERLLSSKDKAQVKQEAEKQIKPLSIASKDYLRDPYIFDFLNLPHESLLEKNIEQALIDNLQKFLLELGKGFAFVARQKRITTDAQDYYIDLVFYNYQLKCFLLADLKLGKLTHQDVGQMDMYVRMYDELCKCEDDNPTIGLILCSQKNDAVAKYSILNGSKQLFASKYLTYLPSEEELQTELQRERRQLTEEQNCNK